MIGTNFFQRLGRALQLPIAVLPIAALFLRLGQQDLFNIPALSAAGSGIFDNLALIFAIGAAAAWSIDLSGAAALAGATSYLILTRAMSALNSTNNMGALAGILSGILAGAVYNRWHSLKLPDFLAFFGGSRSVPIISGLISVLLAFVLGTTWPVMQHFIDLLGQFLQNMGALGAGIYGILNRLLLPTGLHQILNTYVWSQLGHFTNSAGNVINGEITRFYAGDPSAGLFLSGFFPIMIFGLPAAALAMFHAAAPENKKQALGILLSVSMTALITGITEPLEFLFMFLAPMLYGLHTLLTGLSLYLCACLDIHAGFSFSAGLIDLLLVCTFPNSKNLIRLFPLGLFFAAAYYIGFYSLIKRFDLKVPAITTQSSSSEKKPSSMASNQNTETLGASYLQALGGSDNLISLEACITRLRIQVVDNSKIDDPALQALGALAISRLDAANVQVILGPKAEEICEKIQKEWHKEPPSPHQAPPSEPPLQS